MKNIIVTILIVLICCILCFPILAQQNVSERTWDEITFYYKNPSPDKIPQVLSDFLKTGFCKSDEFRKGFSGYVVAYTYGRIAQLEPSIIEKYQQIFEKPSHEDRLFMLKVFQVCGNEQVKEYLSSKLKDGKFHKEKEDISKILEHGIPIALNPLGKESTRADDFDMLWAEFCVTGNAEAVKKIINALEWPERVRPKLQEYFKSSASLMEKEKIAAIMKEEYNILCNVNTAEIGTNVDLDTRIIGHSTRYNDMNWEKFKELRKAINLTDEDVLFIANKGSADWPLIGNAEQHDKVFETCVSEIPKRSGAAKLALLYVGLQGYISRSDNEKAADMAEQMLLLNPNDASTHYALGSLYEKTGNMEKAAQKLSILTAMDSPLAKDLEKEIKYGQLSNLLNFH